MDSEDSLNDGLAETISDVEKLRNVVPMKVKQKMPDAFCKLHMKVII